MEERHSCLSPLRVPASVTVLYGSGAMFGVINLVLKSEQEGEIPAGGRTGKDLVLQLMPAGRTDQIETESVDELGADLG